MIVTDEMITAFQRTNDCSFGGYSREEIAAGLEAALGEFVKGLRHPRWVSGEDQSRLTSAADAIEGLLRSDAAPSPS